MGLLDKLINKIIDGAKKKKTDSIIKKLAKENPDFAKALKKHEDGLDALKKEIKSVIKQKGLKP